LATAVLDSYTNHPLILCMHTPARWQPSEAWAIPWGLSASKNSTPITNSKLPYNYITCPNPGVKRTTGYPPGEIAAKNCQLLCGGDWRLRRSEQTKEWAQRLPEDSVPFIKQEARVTCWM